MALHLVDVEKLVPGEVHLFDEADVADVHCHTQDVREVRARLVQDLLQAVQRLACLERDVVAARGADDARQVHRATEDGDRRVPQVLIAIRHAFDLRLICRERDVPPQLIKHRTHGAVLRLELVQLAVGGLLPDHHLAHDFDIRQSRVGARRVAAGPVVSRTPLASGCRARARRSRATRTARCRAAPRPRTAACRRGRPWARPPPPLPRLDAVRLEHVVDELAPRSAPLGAHRAGARRRLQH